MGLDKDVPCICLDCGRFFHPDGYPPLDSRCPECHKRYWIRRRKEYYANKRANGWVPEYRRKAGRKAYITRMAKMSYKEPEKYQTRMKKERVKDPERSVKIERKAKKLMKQKLGYIDTDLGKVIF